MDDFVAQERVHLHRNFFAAKPSATAAHQANCCSARVLIVMKQPVCETRATPHTIIVEINRLVYSVTRRISQGKVDHAIFVIVHHSNDFHLDALIGREHLYRPQKLRNLRRHKVKQVIECRNGCACYRYGNGQAKTNGNERRRPSDKPASGYGTLCQFVFHRHFGSLNQVAVRLYPIMHLLVNFFGHCYTPSKFSLSIERALVSCVRTVEGLRFNAPPISATDISS